MIAEISLRQRRKSRQDSASPSLRSGERETFTRAPMVACDPSLDNSGIGPTNLPHMQRVKSATSSAWFLLGVAIASEIVGVLGLRFSEGFAAPTKFCLPSTPCHARPSRCSSARGSTSPHFSPRSWSASRPGVRSARSGPKSVAGATVEARIVRSARVAARRGRAPGRDPPKGGALRPTVCVTPLARCPASRCAPLLPCRPDSAAQTMTLVKN